MPQIHLAAETHERLLVTARLMNKTVGEVITLLVDRLTNEPATPSEEPVSPSARVGGPGRYIPPPVSPPDAAVTWIPVYKVYKGHRLEGAFNPRTHEVRLSTGPWANRIFPSPTGAAIAVVEHYSGDVRDSPNTNGRKFWKVVETDKNLHSIIGQR
jgi:hypothetical protein